MGQSLMRGTLILTVASLITRIVGLAYRVYLVRLAGPEVIGLFQMIFPLYFTLMVLASAGLPLAISKMVADRMALNRQKATFQVMSVACWLSVIAGLSVTILLFASAGFISYRLLKDSRTFLALMVVAPGLPAISLASTLKGYFQGTSNMTPVARSQVVEQLVHVAATIGLIFAYRDGNSATMAAVLAAGSLAGDLVGLVYISGCYRADLHKRGRRGYGPDESRESRRGILRELGGLALPVTAGRLIISLNSAVNAALIPNFLRAAGMTLHQSTVAFGELTGMAMNLVTIPTVFTASMATNLVPSVASSKAMGLESTVGRRAGQSLKLTLLVGTLFTSLFLALGRPMCQVLFRSTEAGILLMILAPGALAMYGQHVLTGVLQGLNRPTLPMVCSLVSTAFGTAGFFMFVDNMGLGIRGAAYAISLSMGLGCALCFVFVKRLVNLPPLAGIFARTAACGLMGGLVARLAYPWLLSAGSLEAVALLGACLGGTVAYGGTVLLTRLATVHRSGLRVPPRKCVS